MNALSLPPDFEARLSRNEPMSKHTSWHVGGPADLFFTPLDVTDISAFLQKLEAGTPVMWIGLGSNLLVRDGGIRGAVIETHGVFDELERRNENLIGGDINGGAADLPQLLFRPIAQRVPYATPLEGVYLCSSSTPPGGGVHGMCGYLAARAALRDAL